MRELLNLSVNPDNRNRLLSMGGAIAQTEVLDAESVHALYKFTQDGLNNLHPTKLLNKEQAFSLLVGFSGLQAPAHRERTFTFIYHDPITGKSNYQTACVPRFAEQAPFKLTFDEDSTTASIVPSIAPQDVHQVQTHAVIWDATNHHYSRVNMDRAEVPTAVIASPRSTCAAGCSGCSRGAIKSFEKPNSSYIDEHVAILKNEYAERGWDENDLKSVSITTGSQPTEEREVQMMLEIIASYRKAGFEAARFMIYNYAIQSKAAMIAVRAAGVDGYIGTLETANDELRRKHWGRVKGGQSFEQHLRRYALAHSIGFPIVETNYVVGIDPYEEMIQTIAILDNEGVAVVPNVKRSYTAQQLKDTHPNVWNMGFAYITDAFDACLQTYRHPTIKQFAGQATIRYLNKIGDIRATDYTQLPVRHT